MLIIYRGFCSSHTLHFLWPRFYKKRTLHNGLLLRQLFLFFLFNKNKEILRAPEELVINLRLTCEICQKT